MNITVNQVSSFLKNQFKTGDIVIKLIFINLSVYLALKLIHFGEWLFRFTDYPVQNFISKWLYLPASAGELLIKPYTLFTYQFMHDSFWHLLVNLLMLFFFGKMIISLKGFKQVLPIYVLGGLFGGLIFVLCSSLNLIPMMGVPMVGASASIMAMMGAVALLQPDYPIKFFLLFDVKLKWLVAGFAFLNALSISNPEGAGPGIIHLAGLAFGLTLIYAESKGYSLVKPFNQAVNYTLSFFNRKPRPKVTFVNTESFEEEKAAQSEANVQEKIDAILDKISADGYDSLSKPEKDFLFKTSKKS